MVIASWIFFSACIELYLDVSYIRIMPARKKKVVVKAVEEVPYSAHSTSLRATKGNDDSLDPQEEKVLDWILKAIVIFVLGWLALGVLMAVGGLFGIWK